MLIDYRRLRATIIDFARRRFQTLALPALARRMAQERRVLKTIDTPYFKVPDRLAFPPERIAPERGRVKRIKGVVAHAYIERRAGQPAVRLWYSRVFARPPARVARILARLTAGPAAALAGNVLLRAEQRVGGRFQVQAAARSIRAGRIARRRFRAPRGWHRTTALLPSIGATPRSVPARVRRQADYFPIQDAPAVYVVFWGRRFAREPDTVRRLDDALDQTVLKRPYINGLEQYGVGAGRVVGHTVIANDPPSVAGQTSALGWAANAIVAQAARTTGAPPVWARVGPDPLILIFEPKEVVDAGGNNGYHSVMPIPTAFGDPFGLVNMQVYPFAIAKVPPVDPASDFIDQATRTASHETVETATDTVPAPAGFVDPAKTALGEQGEIADICQEGNRFPWSDVTRVGGVGVATYWSENTQTCYPEGRPTVAIQAPADGTTIFRGAPVAFVGSARDLWTRMVPVTLSWASDRDGNLGGGLGVTPELSVGRHVVTLQATGTDNGMRSASITVNVVSRPPDVRITRPAGGADYPSDQDVAFHGSATDPADGPLTGAALAWTVDGADAGQGTAVTRTLAAGTHSASLRATNLHGESTTRTVTFSVGAPTGGPSVLIELPQDGQFFPGGGDPVGFKGHANDVKDKALTGGALQWFDDYVDSAGVPQSVKFATGETASTTLAAGEHTIRLVATDSDANAATDAVAITVGHPSR